MNDFLRGQCKKLLEKLENKPIARVLNEGLTDYTGKLTLNVIKEKLEANKYLTPFDFSLDLRLLLEPKNTGNPSNAIQNVILEDINTWLNYKLLNMPRSDAELQYMRMQKCIAKLQYIYKALVYTAPKTPKQIIDAAQHRQVPPSREGQHSNQKRIETLQKQIDRIKRPEDLQAVLRILQKYVPQLALSNEVVIEGRFISKQCVAELKAYLNSVGL